MSATARMDAQGPLQFKVGELEAGVQRAGQSGNSQTRAICSSFALGMMVSAIGLLTMQHYGLDDASFTNFFFAPAVHRVQPVSGASQRVALPQMMAPSPSTVIGEAQETSSSSMQKNKPPLMTRRAVLPSLALLGLVRPALAETDIEAQQRVSKKVEIATQEEWGLDVERRGASNEKALFPEDYYFKTGIRPKPDKIFNSPDLPPQGELPFVPVQRRYTGYKKFAGRVNLGLELYSGTLRSTIQNGAWTDLPALLEKGAKGKFSISTGEGTGVAESYLRSSCRALGLFANTVLQSDIDTGISAANLLARYVINEVYFSLDDIAAAGAAGNKDEAKAAWSRGKEWLNIFLRIVNFQISSKVGDQFALVDVSI